MKEFAMQYLQNLGMEAVYFLCLIAGLIYAVIAAVMNLLGAGHEGGAEVSADSGVHFSPLSPVTIAMFVTSFGAGGIISMHILRIKGVWSIAIATGSGFAIAALTFFIFYKMFKITQSSSTPSIMELVGVEAEVITTIPADGLGEIAYVVRGTRFNAPARSDDGKEHRAHDTVVITRVTGNTYYVKAR